MKRFAHIGSWQMNRSHILGAELTALEKEGKAAAGRSQSADCGGRTGILLSWRRNPSCDSGWRTADD